MPTVNNAPIVFIVLQPYSIAEKDSNHNNRPQKHSTHPQVENITLLPKYNYSLKNTTSRLLKRQRYRSIRIGHIFHGAFWWLFFYNQKSFVRRRLRRYRLRHKIRAIKTRLNNPLRFLQRTNSIRRYLANDLTFSSFASDVQNTKAFSQQTIPTKIKNQPLESERTHFDTGFNNSNVAMHRQTFIFLLLYQNTTVQ